MHCFGCKFYLQKEFQAIFYKSNHIREMLRIFLFLSYDKIGEKFFGWRKDFKNAQWWQCWMESYNKYLRSSRKRRLKATNKLTNKHINFQNNRMNLKLAVQTLSESVCNSLMFLLSMLPDPTIQYKFVNCKTNKFMLYRRIC